MTKGEREQWLEQLESETGKASSVLMRCKPDVSWALRKLAGAHIYLHAALVADFVREAESGECIGPLVQMSDSTTKPTREFLIEYLFETQFGSIAVQEGGAEFLSRVRRKAERILQAQTADQSGQLRSGPEEKKLL